MSTPPKGPNGPIFGRAFGSDRRRATRIDEPMNEPIAIPPMPTVDLIEDPDERERMQTSCWVFYETFCPLCAEHGYLPLDLVAGWSELVGSYIGGIGGEYEWAMWQIGKIPASDERMVAEFADIRTILGHLIGSGWIELITVDNWPALRPIGGWEDIAIYFEEGERPDVLADIQAGNVDVAYQAYLDSPEWAHKRAIKLAEAGHRCQVCNAGSHLHVHHRTYERRGNEALSDLTVLCRTCHEAFHKSGRRVK